MTRAENGPDGLRMNRGLLSEIHMGNQVDFSVSIRAFASTCIVQQMTSLGRGTFLGLPCLCMKKAARRKHDDIGQPKVGSTHLSSAAS